MILIVLKPNPVLFTQDGFAVVRFQIAPHRFVPLFLINFAFGPNHFRFFFSLVKFFYKKLNLKWPLDFNPLTLILILIKKKKKKKNIF